MLRKIKGERAKERERVCGYVCASEDGSKPTLSYSLKIISIIMPTYVRQTNIEAILFTSICVSYNLCALPSKEVCKYIELHSETNIFWHILLKESGEFSKRINRIWIYHGLEPEKKPKQKPRLLGSKIWFYFLDETPIENNRNIETC